MFYAKCNTVFELTPKSLFRPTSKKVALRFIQLWSKVWYLADNLCPAIAICPCLQWSRSLPKAKLRRGGLKPKSMIFDESKLQQCGISVKELRAACSLSRPLVRQIPGQLNDTKWLIWRRMWQILISGIIVGCLLNENEPYPKTMPNWSQPWRPWSSAVAYSFGKDSVSNLNGLIL